MQREQVLRRVRTVHNKAKENFEERGLGRPYRGRVRGNVGEQAGRAWEPSAPVLCAACLAASAWRGAQDEFELSVTDELEG